jgi:hypothetical protein
VRLVDVEGREHTVPVDDIDDRRPGRSAMPANVCDSLTPSDIRDLIEFLALCTPEQARADTAANSGGQIGSSE